MFICNGIYYKKTKKQENAEQTQELLQASSVIASATGRSMEDVMDRIRSGLLGITQAIDDLGVNANVALLEALVALLYALIASSVAVKAFSIVIAVFSSISKKQYWI